jgi:hypothetical protein
MNQTVSLNNRKSLLGLFGVTENRDSKEVYHTMFVSLFIVPFPRRRQIKYTNVLRGVTNQNIVRQVGVDDKPNPFGSPIISAEARAE